MFTFWPGCHNETTKSSKFRRQIRIAALRVLLNKVLQNLKENPEYCDKNFFNATNFIRFPVHLFKPFSPQLNDITDSDSLVFTMLLDLISQNSLLDTLNDQNDTDVKEYKKKWLLFSLTLILVLYLEPKFLRNIIFLPAHG